MQHATLIGFVTLAMCAGIPFASHAQEPTTRAETLQRQRDDKAQQLAPPASRCRAFMTHGEREKNVVAAGVCGGSMRPIVSGQNGNPG